MTEKELKKLGRAELLELLVGTMKENDILRSELEKTKAQAENRVIAIGNSGTMAEAALILNSVFEAADKAAQQYLENIRLKESTCEKMISDAKAEADGLILNATKAAQKIEDDARITSEQYWKDITLRLEEFYKSREGLKEMLNTLNR